MNGPQDDDPYARHLGLQITAPGVVRLTVRAELVNSVGTLLGPVGFAVVDYAMGNIVWSGLEEGKLAVTVNVAINYLAGCNGGQVTCTAQLDRRGRRVAATSARVESDTGRLLMTAVGTFAIS
jgi:uncharacterized protein (TIGR00369 family)